MWCSELWRTLPLDEWEAAGEKVVPFRQNSLFESIHLNMWFDMLWGVTVVQCHLCFQKFKHKWQVGAKGNGNNTERIAQAISKTPFRGWWEWIVTQSSKCLRAKVIHSTFLLTAFEIHLLSLCLSCMLYDAVEVSGGKDGLMRDWDTLPSHFNIRGYDDEEAAN